HIERAARARREARLPAKLDRQRRADEIAPGLEDDLTIAGRLPHASFEREEIASTISVTEPESETLGHRREDERRMLRRSRDHGAGDVLRDLRILGRVLEGAGQEAQDGLRSLGGRDSPHLGTFDRIGAKGTERRRLADASIRRFAEDVLGERAELMLEGVASRKHVRFDRILIDHIVPRSRARELDAPDLVVDEISADGSAGRVESAPFAKRAPLLGREARWLVSLARLADHAFGPHAIGLGDAEVRAGAVDEKPDLVEPIPISLCEEEVERGDAIVRDRHGGPPVERAVELLREDLPDVA